MNRSNRQMRRTLRLAPSTSRQRQRGAAAVFAAIAMIAAVVAMLLGFNVGALYYAQRELQKEATLAALSGVQTGGGCVTGTPGSLASVTTIVQQTIQSNGNLSSVDALARMTGINGSPAVELGQTVDTTGTHVFTPLAQGNPQINSVRVNLTRPTPSLIGGTLFPGGAPVTVKASATARQQPVGAFSIGSTLASLNTSNSVLNPLLSALLGTSVNLSAVDYQGLAQTQISLANLMVAANVTDLNSLLAINTNLSQLQPILTTATNTVNPSVAQLIQGLTLGNAQANTGVALADLLGNIGNGLNPTVTDAAAQVPFIDVLDMLIALGDAAAAKNGITLALPVSVNVPGLLNTFVFLKVLEPPQPSGFGPVGTSQHTSQIQLKIRTNVDTAGVLGALPVLDALAQVTINLGIDVTVAEASGTIATLVCPRTNAPNPSATVAVTTGLTRITLGGFSGNPQSDPDITAVDAPLLNVKLVVPLVTLGVKTPATDYPPGIGSGSGTTSAFISYLTPTQPITGTTHDYLYLACNSTVQNPCTAADPNNPQTPVSSTDIAAGISGLVGSLASKNNLNVDVLGIGLGPLLDPIIDALNTALLTPVTSLVDSILNPLLAALGVQVGSGTVLWQAFETGMPVIVTTALPAGP